MRWLEKLKQNKFVLGCYAVLTYSEQGRGTSSRFYNPIIEAMGVITYIIVITHYQFTKFELVLYTIDALLFFTILGYLYNKNGILKIDREAQVVRDPIQSRIYQAANIIIMNERRKKK